MKEDRVLEMFDGDKTTIIPQNNEVKEKAIRQPVQIRPYFEELINQRTKLLEENSSTGKITDNDGIS